MKYIILFILSIVSIFLFEDSMLSHFSIQNFLPLFVFISLPFLLAAILGWKKGFSLSILTSGLLLIFSLINRHSGDSIEMLYAVFFACFSIIYLLAAVIIAVVTAKPKSAHQ